MNISVFSVRNLQKLFAAIALFAMVFSPFANVQFATAHHDPFGGVPQTGNIQICHITGNGGYIVNSPSISATGGNISISGGHANHGNSSSGDVIPPFHFNDNGNILSYPGKNWTAQTEDIWDNGTCTGDGILPQTATLTLAKTVVNDNGGTAADTAWTLTATGPTAGVTGTEGQAAITNKVVTAGTYNLSESSVTGYTNGTTWSCSAGTMVDGDTVTLAANNVATCTITNNDNPATLTLVKNKVGGPAANTAWTLSADSSSTDISGVTGAGAVTNAQVNAGTYTLTESGAVPLYSQTGLSCDGATVFDGNKITLTNGGSATCTFTNTYTPTHGTLTVTKVLQNLYGAIVDVANFTFSVGANLNVAFDNTDNSNEFSLQAGDYTVVENSATGFTTTYSGDCNGAGQVTIVADGSKTCTVTNTGVQPKLTLNKTIVNNSGTGEVLDDTAFTLTATGPTSISGVEGNAAVTNAGVNVGTYTLSETGPTGDYNASYSCLVNGNGVAVDQGNPQVTLALGDVAVCTITNDDKNPTTATVTFTKILPTEPNYNLPDADVDDFSFSVEGNGTVYHGSTLELGAGTYDVAELDGEGYSVVYGGACAGGSLTIDSDDFGNGLECTITNTELPACSNGINDDGQEDALVDSADPGCENPNDDSEGDPETSITINKVVDGEGVSEEQTFNFDFSWDEGAIDASIAAEDEPFKVVVTPAQGLVITEDLTGLSRWSLTGIDCGDDNDLDQNPLSVTLNVSVGEQIVCEFTNHFTPRDSGGNDENIIVTKEVTDGSDTETFFAFDASWMDSDGPVDFLLKDGQSRDSEDLQADEYYNVYEMIEKGGEWDLDSLVCTSTQSHDEDGYAVDGFDDILLHDGETITCVFTNDQNLYELEGYVWEDTDKDGNFDEGELPLSNWGVNASAEGETTRETTSDENGFYRFTVPAGTWTISEDVEGGWEQIFPFDEQNGVHIVTVPAEEFNEEITLLDSVFNFFVPTAHAAVVDTLGYFNFGNVRIPTGCTSNCGGGNGTRVELSDRDDDDEPEGEVLGEQISVVPVGAPDAGKGGSALPTDLRIENLLSMATPRRMKTNVQ